MLRLICMAALRLALPVLAIVWLAAFASQFMQVGWLFAPRVVAPDLARLSPIRGISRIFGGSSALKSGLDVLKVSVILAVAATALAGHSTRIAALPYMSALQALREGGLIVLNLALCVAAALLMLGILDFMHQRWRLSRDLRMTRQQIKDELRQTEGDPATRRRRLLSHRESGTIRPPAAVSQADVVLVDDEHIAVAIRFDESTMSAPRVVAKGARTFALRIRDVALHDNIPVVERPSLARELYRRAPLDREIGNEHYRDVAEVLAHAYRLRGGTE
jgi:flagellar biosynthetic protein FlhB